ncbi:hypothetical protein ScPMuIL_011830 [Solemya velum]
MPTKACDFRNGSSVVVLFTSFAGTDPHGLLLESANERNMSVIFSLPSAPVNYETHQFDEELLPAYYEWIRRVTIDHKTRYSRPYVDSCSNHDYNCLGSVQNGKRRTERNLYSTLSSYFLGDIIPLFNITKTHLKHVVSTGNIIHDTGKRFGVVLSIDLSRIEFNKSISAHVEGYKSLIAEQIANITVVQEGRGTGRGSYHWKTETDRQVRSNDPILQRILSFRKPYWSENVTNEEAFTGSNQELFRILGQLRDSTASSYSKTQLWLSVEAFEFLRDRPCLPVDTKSSGNAEIMDRTTKSRIDMALTASSAAGQKVVSFAWDPGFTCTSASENRTLADEIRGDLQRPILANCSFHSSDNRSVVVLGYKLQGETQGFTVDWPDENNQRHTDRVNGYYFELDYGQRHDRVPSLQYVQLYDVPNVNTLNSRGFVVVTADGAYHPCIFTYDFRIL